MSKAMKEISREEWEVLVKNQICLNQQSIVRFLENRPGIVHATWVGVNPFVEPLLGVYFCNLGKGWAHE